MNPVYLSYNNLITPLGFSSEEVVGAIEQGKTGLQKFETYENVKGPITSAIISVERLNSEFKGDITEGYSKLEKMMILSITSVLEQSRLNLNERVGLIISTTKGNIEALDSNSELSQDQAYLWKLGSLLKNHFGFYNDAIVLSNACISGLLSIINAKRFIDQGIYDNIIVVAADVVTPFVLSGFNSFQALSKDVCKPYSKARNGINLGEAAASLLVTNNNGKLAAESVEIIGGASINDANHISGPSRTGEGLYRSVKRALSYLPESESIDYISAHGTATEYNDEMEAIAFNRLGLQEVPLNSLKGYFGHTLGASGLLETVVGMHSLHRNELYKTYGFENLGVSKSLNIIAKKEERPLTTMLKTTSGFGGCNAAAILKKIHI